MDFLFSSVKHLVLDHLSHKPIFSTLQYWLVHHPQVLNFTWNQGQTPASSPLFLVLTILSYLSLTLLLPQVSLPRITPWVLKSLAVIHNAIILALSITMALGSALSVVNVAPDIDYVVCFPKGTQPKGPIFFWSYVFYLSKILEYADTLLIILTNSMRRLTFLHIYHHAVVVVMCYISLQTSQSMFHGVLITNTMVHVLMYYYYLLCALGIHPKCKKLVTDCQIVQFFSSFGTISWIFYYHFTGPGCSGIWAWCFELIFIVSLLVMFLDFHSKNYSRKTKRVAKEA